MSLAAYLSVSFSVLSLLLFVGVASSDAGSAGRRRVGRVVAMLTSWNPVLRVVHWLLSSTRPITRLVYVLLSLAYVWFVTVILIAGSHLGDPGAGPPIGAGFGDMPLAGKVFATVVLVFLASVALLVASMMLTAVILYPLALATGLAKRGGSDKGFAIGLGFASGTAGIVLKLLG